MTLSEELTALTDEAVAKSGGNAVVAASLAIEHYEKHLSQHYDIYPTDTPLTMKEDPCLTDSRG